MSKILGAAKNHDSMTIIAVCLVIAIVWWSISLVTRKGRSSEKHLRGINEDDAESQWEIVENLNIEDDWHSPDDSGS